MIRARLALITGASSGLGQALCQALSQQKIPLLITGRDPVRLETVAQEARQFVEVIAVPLDLAERSERKKLIALIHKHVPDLVINNAGFGLYGDVLDHSTDEQLEILEVNGNALLEITLEAARALKEKRKPGTFLNISSAASFFVFPGFSVYAAAKSFVREFSQALDVELKPFGIRVLTSCPGQINTFFRNRAAKNHPQKTSALAMSTEKAVPHLLRQIETKKSLVIFDWRTHFFTLVGPLFPKRLVQMILRKMIAARYSKKS